MRNRGEIAKENGMEKRQKGTRLDGVFPIGPGGGTGRKKKAGRMAKIRGKGRTFFPLSPFLSLLLSTDLTVHFPEGGWFLPSSEGS
jgi:hypothetical protein